MKVLIAAALSAATILAAGMDLTITPGADTQFMLEVAKTGFLSGKKHQFLFDRYRGDLRYDAANPENSRVDLTIESGSIRCIDTWVSDKDKVKITKAATDDMLAVSRFPQMRFVSTAVRSKGADQFEVDGNLTIRNISKPVTVLVTMHQDASGKLMFQGSSKFKMTLYGLKPPSAALGTIGTKDEMAVTFKLAASPQ
jgi:polyisoprenoid-binding protein YceI